MVETKMGTHSFNDRKKYKRKADLKLEKWPNQSTELQLWLPTHPSSPGFWTVT